MSIVRCEFLGVGEPASKLQGRLTLFASTGACDPNLVRPFTNRIGELGTIREHV